jgi:hypothetical protein
MHVAIALECFEVDVPSEVAVTDLGSEKAAVGENWKARSQPSFIVAKVKLRSRPFRIFFCGIPSKVCSNTGKSSIDGQWHTKVGDKRTELELTPPPPWAVVLDSKSLPLSHLPVTQPSLFTTRRSLLFNHLFGFAYRPDIMFRL